MAGIGFELRKLASNDSFWGFLRAHLYAGIMSSGAWIISIGILTAIYLYITQYLGHTVFSIQFLVAVTYLVSSSLVVSSIFQHSLNRFIADKIFEDKPEIITPNFLAATFILILISMFIGCSFMEGFLSEQSLIIKLLMVSSFIVLNIVWLFSNALAGLKNYRFILFAFLMSYAVIFILAINLYQFQLVGLLLAFYIGHVILLTAFLIFLLTNYPAKRLFHWEIFHFMKNNHPLIFGGLFFYLGIWVDKYCFWINDNTSMPILGSLRASPIYDMPNFIAFILIIPGMAMFFYEVEANFSRYYHYYYDAIREGATLHEINEKHDELVSIARTCLLNTTKVQTVVAIFSILLTPEILRLLGLAPIYTYLLRIDIVAASLLTLFIGQLNLLYYLNRAQTVFYITALFFILNLFFTYLSFYLGPLYYGYGFAIALLCCNTLSIVALIKSFKKMTFYSFMSN